MPKGRTRSAGKKLALAFLCCGGVFCVALALLFSWYRGRVDREFDILVEKNLMAYAENQCREAQGAIAGAWNALRPVATMMERSDVDPNSPWVQGYLEQLGQRQGATVSIEYITMERLSTSLESPEVIQADRDTYAALTRGEEVISDVRLSQRLGNRYFFSVAVPVVQYGQTVGALRGVISADRLLQTVQTGYFGDPVKNCLVRSNGDLIPVHSDNAALTGRFADMLREMGLTGEGVETLKRGLAEGSGVYRVEQGSGEAIYVSVAALGYNDWHVVSFTRAGEVTRQSGSILRYTLITCGVLVSMTVGVGAVLFLQFLRQRRALDYERDRYAVLSKFTDTILMEYSYLTDTAVFTSNAMDRLAISSLRLTNFFHEDCLELLHPDENAAIKDLRGYIPEEGEQGSRELRLKGRDGSYFWCLCQYQAVYDGGHAVTLLCKLVDISAQKQREQSLIEQSEEDPLTRLYNKATVARRVDGSLEGNAKQGFLLMLDIDDFKQVNDRLGHQTGDQVIVRVASALRSVFREGDILGRGGGDEFVVFMPGADERSVAQHRAETLLQRMKALGEKDGLDFSCSIGIAAAPEDGTGFAALFRAADQAMYRAKAEGKHTSRFSTGPN